MIPPKILPFTIVLFLVFINSYGQQEPQYTQYNYNTMTVNPGYTGSRGHLTITSLFRNQWAGIEGAPATLSFGLESPVGLFDGFGISIIHDELGPSQETFIDGNYAHHLILNRNGDRLALGIKAGMKFLSLDWSKGRYREPEAAFNKNINSEILPALGAGLFYYTNRFYLGASTPNLLNGKHYDDVAESQASDKMHLYFIGGYVIDLNPDLKFKPSIFVKNVLGGAVSFDASLNFLIHETLNLGVNYRLEDSLSALMGFQISTQIDMGYAYDYSINALNSYNQGTHEIFFRYQLISKVKKLKSPRFF
ncbi:type IX secretion system membrane protein PorP/SprF [Maribacter polysaccharolyticus]|uniref:PorP/SprF family type IX secretion system membrane protein n=1 Tax=Maribacter polysaccharolyticus TaxID=3020831 RepID=UPI00237F498C|nr:type IX secretion system membrane protein PorP/SprF [Maribacter polysaccharolyticus]MDE3742203.1 type IX secretion system membrane protein PorP/SprF [Maribacter polysaccharolyticus]